MIWKVSKGEGDMSDCCSLYWITIALRTRSVGACLGFSFWCQIQWDLLNLDPSAVLINPKHVTIWVQHNKDTFSTETVRCLDVFNTWKKIHESYNIYNVYFSHCIATINSSNLMLWCFEKDANWIVTITRLILSVPVTAVQGQLYHSWIRNSLNTTLFSIPLLHSVVLVVTIWLKDQGFIRYFSEHNKSWIFIFTLTHFRSELKSVI